MHNIDIKISQNRYSIILFVPVQQPLVRLPPDISEVTMLKAKKFTHN